MSRITIIVPDGMVGVDGAFHHIPGLADLVPDGLHALQWHGVEGGAEYPGAEEPYQYVTDLSPFQAAIDAWEVEEEASQPPPMTAELAREIVRGRIEAWRTREEAGSVIFEHAGRRWDASMASRDRLNEPLRLSALPEGFFWTDADNNDVPVSMADLQSLDAAMAAALVEQGFAIHVRQREMKAEIASMTDPDSIIAYPVGWPQ